MNNTPKDETPKNEAPEYSAEQVIRDYRGDGDFEWTDVQVGVLIKVLEDLEPFAFAFRQWAANPTSPAATGQALQAAGAFDKVYPDV